MECICYIFELRKEQTGWIRVVCPRYVLASVTDVARCKAVITLCSYEECTSW